MTPAYSPDDRTRFQTVTEKIPKDATGLKANLFVHADFDGDGNFESIRFSEKGKDGSTLDKILNALGDAATDIIRKGPKG